MTSTCKVSEDLLTHDGETFLDVLGREHPSHAFLTNPESAQNSAVPYATLGEPRMFIPRNRTVQQTRFRRPPSAQPPSQHNLQIGLNSALGGGIEGSTLEAEDYSSLRVLLLQLPSCEARVPDRVPSFVLKALSRQAGFLLRNLTVCFHKFWLPLVGLL